MFLKVNKTCSFFNNERPFFKLLKMHHSFLELLQRISLTCRLGFYSKSAKFCTLIGTDVILFSIQTHVMSLVKCHELVTVQNSFSLIPSLVLFC